MGCAKHNRGNQRVSPAKPDSDSPRNLDKEWMVPLKYHKGAAPSSNSNPNVDSSSWVLCTEDQLEEIVLKNFEIMCKDIVSKLVAWGYNEDAAVKAILQNGHCYGGMDVASNILYNSLTCLNDGYLEKGGFKPMFSDLRQFEECSLAMLVSLLQEVRVLDRGDAMWCLLMSNFHVGKASTIRIPVGGQCPSSIDVGKEGGLDLSASANLLFRALQLRRDIEFPKRFNLSPSLKSLLKLNVATFATGFRASPKYLQSQDKVFSGNDVASNDSSSVSRTAVDGEQSGDSDDVHNRDDMWRKFLDQNIDEMLSFLPDDEKDEVIVTLLRQIKDLEKQVKERKDWAHQKAIQAARKLSDDLIELKKLKMEREESHGLENGKELLGDETMKRLSEIENAWRKASGQMDQANAAVKKLEEENAEIKAELEASKLSASESVTNCLQVAKREKKCLKRLLALEKQKAKIKQNISDEKQKILEIQEELTRIKQHEKEVEAMGKEELKAKEEALRLIEQERRSKEAAKTNNKRNLKALHLKIEIDFQRRKDDLLRLEQEISRLKAAAQSKDAGPQRETIAKLLEELDNVNDFSEIEVNGNRECIVCREDDVSVIFLPCAHQIMCAGCGEEYGRKGKVVCPCCRVSIEQRIHVFGASS
ncbi:hypothetical protein RJT34_05582 [Clitoria ternatea]|uniref:RING-type domain-containing protein n=1 Tax=Clitoria ternatea TaxID=43366 RepID=A0AAN9K3A7_CLITE